MTPRISVYVPCYNAEAWIERVLQGVLAQTLRPDEIIVVDDGSRDRTAEIAARFPVTLIRQEQNRGLAAARNTAMRAARNELVAALDSDVVPEPAWLEHLAPHFENSRVALGGGKLVEAVQRTLADRWRAFHLRQHRGDGPISNPPFVFGANTMARRSAVLGVGGYDERLCTNGEDSNLSFRLRERGWTTFYEPAAVCRHLREDTVYSVLTTFWRYRRDFLNPMTPARIWRMFRYQHIGSARYAFQQDMEARRYEFLGMDALLLPVSFWNDVKLWQSEPSRSRGAASGQAANTSTEVTS
jgi:cellulose synthase/poly-beta-1,6-N-acetylglucosamine synthase-like glycosyltransferase